MRNLQPEGYGVGDFDLKDSKAQPQVVDRRYDLVDQAHAVYHAGYVFLPITFDKNGKPTIEWRDEWRLEDFE